MKLVVFIMTTTVLALAAGTGQAQTTATAQADALLGQWWLNGQTGKIEIFKAQGKYHGKIIWRTEARNDTENPDPALRNRSVIGITFLKDFVYDGGQYVDGSVYSIENGGTYSGKLWLEDDRQTLKMRGYLGISLFGRTATLTRAN